MNVSIDLEDLEDLIKSQVEEIVRKRVKEMQGTYTSKEYLKGIITSVVWDKMDELFPDVDTYISTEIRRCLQSNLDEYKRLKISKEQLLEYALSYILERDSNKD